SAALGSTRYGAPCAALQEADAAAPGSRAANLARRRRARNSTVRKTGMGSSGKRKTTMAKLNRERRLIERRGEKQAKKDARKRAAAHDPSPPAEHADVTTP